MGDRDKETERRAGGRRCMGALLAIEAPRIYAAR